MKAGMPQFLYLILILPVLFAITMVFDGLYSIIKKKEITGWINLISGLLFAGFVIAGYILLGPEILK